MHQKKSLVGGVIEKSTLACINTASPASIVKFSGAVMNVK